MQKVEGSSPFIRFARKPRSGGAFCVPGAVGTLRVCVTSVARAAATAAVDDQPGSGERDGWDRPRVGSRRNCRICE